MVLSPNCSRNYEILELVGEGTSGYVDKKELLFSTFFILDKCTKLFINHQMTLWH